jgi:hypothetical protein
VFAAEPGQGREVARAPAYIYLMALEQDGERVTLWFGHMTVTIVGKGLEPLAAGRRRQVVYSVPAFHVSDVEARGEPHWGESTKISKAAEPEEWGSWAG